MKRLFLVLALLFAAALPAQAPVAVPIPKEPHHHLVLENDYVRVFRVSLPAHDATLLHQHDVPYLYVSLGPADVINAVQGKPEARIVMADGQVGYSPGHFAHIARTDAGSTFDNVTIELLKPQGEPHNLCARIIDGPLNDCPQPGPNEPLPQPPPISYTRMFETNEILLTEAFLAPRGGSVALESNRARLMISLTNSELEIEPPGKVPKLLSFGNILWIAAGNAPRFIRHTDNTPTRFLLLSFKDKDDMKKP
jgi:hypothetical protein